MVSLIQYEVHFMSDNIAMREICMYRCPDILLICIAMKQCTSAQVFKPKYFRTWNINFEIYGAGLGDNPNITAMKVKKKHDTFVNRQ